MNNHQSLRQAYADLKASKGGRQRDLAAALQIREAELLSVHVGAGREGGLTVSRMRPDWPGIIESLHSVGEVMALTRNASCVHEKLGVYNTASHQGSMGLVLDADIDLRVFYGQWAMGFAVSEISPQGNTSHSLQFFDAQGEAIHKVHAKPQTNIAAWQALVKRWLDDDQTPERPVLTARAAPVVKPDHLIDVQAFRADWAGLRDTHDFFGMLRRHGLQRLQAMKLAEPRFAQLVPVDTVRRLLDSAALDGVSIMVFVGNPGMIQIHTGPIRRAEPMGCWLNVLDERFNLHLREDHIAEVWVVRKPTVDGVVTSIEVFDARGDTIVQFFGERKPGKPEREDWRALVEDLIDEAMPCMP